MGMKHRQLANQSNPLFSEVFSCVHFFCGLFFYSCFLCFYVCFVASFFSFFLRCFRFTYWFTFLFMFLVSLTAKNSSTNNDELTHAHAHTHPDFAVSQCRRTHVELQNLRARARIEYPEDHYEVVDPEGQERAVGGKRRWQQRRKMGPINMGERELLEPRRCVARRGHVIRTARGNPCYLVVRGAEGTLGRLGKGSGEYRGRECWWWSWSWSWS